MAFIAWFALLLAHLLILFLIIVVPIRGAQRYRMLMRSIARRPELRATFYVQGMLGQWLMLLPLLIIIPGLGWSWQFIGLQGPIDSWVTTLCNIVAALLVLACYAQVFYIHRASRTPDGLAQLRQSMSGPLHMLPRIPKERALWVLLSLTAGICEEILYRGFLPAYLNHIFPDVPFFLAIVIAAALFGIGHLYQKLSGVLGTGLVGLVFGLLYLFTGSLLLSMIVHALFDLRLLFINVPALVNTPEEAPTRTPTP